MARGYMSRMMAQNVGRNTVAAPPLPTAADFTAALFDQEWAFGSCHNSLTKFSVLALDDEHAKIVGERKLERLYGVGVLADMRCLVNVRRQYFDADSLARHLEVEDPQDWQDRQDRHKLQGAA